MDILITSKEEFMSFNFDICCLTRFLSVLPFQLLGFSICILVMNISTLKAKQSRYCNYPASDWQILRRLLPFLAEINENFYYCCCFCSFFWIVCFWEGLRCKVPFHCLLKGMGESRVWEFLFYLLLFILILSLQSVFMFYSPSFYGPLKARDYVYSFMYSISPFFWILILCLVHTRLSISVCWMTVIAVSDYFLKWSVLKLHLKAK